MTPRATVRLQLTREFDFDAARAQIDYYAALGISHFYLSPIFRAREGSTHGYDTVDFSHVSDELGGMAALERLVAALRERDMGVILDIVPNHMGVAGKHNAWWNDVLLRGRQSAFAHHFDIDWTPEQRSLQEKVLMPFLGEPLAAAIESGKISIVDEEGYPAIAYFDSRWPVSNADATRDMTALLDQQHYVLDDWRVAPERINWRRFFDISELAALRIEDDKIFADVHKTIFILFEHGLIDGVRVDHVDGLSYPIEYCHKLRDELEARRSRRPETLRDSPAYIVVEKIFASHEPQRDWGVAGTTGYDFMDQVAALLHNPAGQGALDILWRRVSARPWEFRAAVSEARRQVLGESFVADLERVARAFHALAKSNAALTHITFASIKRALVELVVAFPVYRCYGMPGALPPEDAAILALALERTMREVNAQDYDAVDFIARCLRDPLDSEDKSAQRETAVRFQQLTAPIAAKAIEDTVFYREMRLLSRNEVGSDPNAFSMGIDEFHAACAARARRFPHSLLTTATHDHKRGEDARARLMVLSDDAERWSEIVSSWVAMNAEHKTVSGTLAAPDLVDEFMLYQTLVSTWPLDPMDDDAKKTFAARVEQWFTKALRESKRHSSWIAPNTAYEESCLRFLRAILDSPFASDLNRFVDSIGAASAATGLAQTFLRLTTPGVPDLYQGCDFWDFSLVDPDNRRAVDYAKRSAALNESADLAQLLQSWHDGRVKQQLIARVLRHRRNHLDVYTSGEYVPVATSGSQSANVIAFERRYEGQRLLCVASRWHQSINGSPLGVPIVDAMKWGDTSIAVGDATRFADVLNGASVELSESVPVAQLLAKFPVALLFATGNR